MKRPRPTRGSRRPPLLGVLGLLGALAVFGSWTSAAHAKPKRTRAATATGKPARTESSRSPRAPSAEATRAEPDTTAGRAKSDDGNADIGAEGAGAGAGAATSDKGGGKPSKTRVYTFGAMDVEGKLKTPQLLYFLNRVKLELEMSAPDRRSFMKELDKSADDPHL